MAMTLTLSEVQAMWAYWRIKVLFQGTSAHKAADVLMNPHSASPHDNL